MQLASKTIAIACWTLLRSGGKRHVLGYRLPGLRGRRGSPIRPFDPSTRTATTASGNRYVLEGYPSYDGLDDAVVRDWLTTHDLSRHDFEIIGVEGL